MLSGPCAPSGYKKKSGKTKAVVVVNKVMMVVVVAIGGTQIPAVIVPGAATDYRLFLLTVTQNLTPP